MPMTPELRHGIDRIRDYLFGGGYPNPVANAEQLSFLIYFYMYEAEDAKRVRVSQRPDAPPHTSAFDGEWKLRNPRNAREPGATTVPRELLRWSSWAQALNSERLVNWVRDEVFPFHAELAADGVMNFMDEARLTIDEPTVLTQVVSQLNDLRLDRVDADTKGDLFEHVLRQIRRAGELGQFRTPRHIIRTIVQLINPKIGETVYDPAAGTAGFLVGAYDHIRLANSSSAGIEETEADGKVIRRGIGDLLDSNAVRQLQGGTFFGTDVDQQFVRLATMNLTLRGLDNVRVLRRDALTRSFDRGIKAEFGLPTQGFDVILANPPFSGQLDKDRIVEEVKVGNTGQTEILFLQYMLNHLQDGGRCGVVVPEGVLFGSTSAHRELRRKLIENNTVEAVLSLPSGVFKPYSGVKTSVLIFRKGGKSQQIMFLHADNDGYRLDANHNKVINDDDLPGLTEAFRNRKVLWTSWCKRDMDTDWAKNWWFAEFDAIRTADFNLTANRYRPLNRAKLKSRNPIEILDEIHIIETKIRDNIDVLTGIARETTLRTSTLIVPLSQLCDMDRRGIRPDEDGALELPFVGVENVEPESGRLNLSNRSRTGSQKSKAFLFDKRHVLYAKLRPYLNKVAVPEFSGRCSTELIPLLPKKGVPREFVAYLLRRRETVDYAMASVTGARMPRTDMDLLFQLPVPLPSLEEQQRISDILIRAAKIDQLRARADRCLREFMLCPVRQDVE